MGYFVVLRESIFPILLIIFIAYLYNKFFKPAVEDIAKVSVYLFTPIMVFDSFLRHNVVVSTLYKPMVFMLLYTFSLIFIGKLFAKILKLNTDDSISFTLSISMMNIGNYGLPLIFFTFGQSAEKYSILYYIVFNISISTIAVYMSSRGRNVKSLIKDVFKVPIFLAVIVSLVITNFALKVPSSIMKCMILMSDAAVPLLTFVLGLQLSKMFFRVSYLPAIAAATFLRLVLAPFIAFLIVYILDIKGLERSVAIVQSSTSSALIPLMLNIIFKRPTDLLASIILVTTITSAITLPFVILIFT
jgi:predicted permease